MPVTAQVVSRTGRPIPGVAATFQVRGAGGAAPALDTADARGTVSTVWTLDPSPGRQQLAIAVEGVPVSPVVTAEADPAGQHEWRSRASSHRRRPAIPSSSRSWSG
jgi:hypothetical protein